MSFHLVYCLQPLLHSSLLQWFPMGWSPLKSAPSRVESGPQSNIWFLVTGVFIPNGISIDSAVSAQLVAECPYTLQWAAHAVLTCASRTNLERRDACKDQVQKSFGYRHASSAASINEAFDWLFTNSSSSTNLTYNDTDMPSWIMCVDT